MPAPYPWTLPLPSPPTIILFNGPPSSGKDTAVSHLLEGWRTFNLPGRPVLERMSFPIKRAFAGAFDAPIDYQGHVLGWEDAKDFAHPLLSNKTYRQWQIDFSENFMKPLYGEAIFVELFIYRVIRNYLRTDVLLVPDCGFEVEASFLRSIFPSLHIIQIFRKGYDFSRDSRSYLDPHKYTTHPVLNETLADYLDATVSIVRRILEPAS